MTFRRTRLQRIHLATALLHLSLLPLSTAGAAISFTLLVLASLASLVRFPGSRADLWTLFRKPLVLALLAWVAWAALSLTWSADAGEGLAQLRALRMLLLPFLLWPLRRFAGLWLAAVLAGVAAQNVIQLCQLSGILELKAAHAGRIGGLAHPIHTGLWSAAALCWHLARVLEARGSARFAATLGGSLAAFGLVVAQSRGPWIAAAVALPLEIALLARAPASGAGGSRVRQRLPALALGGALIVAMLFAIQGGEVARRIESAFSQLDSVRNEGICTTDVGLRICQWGWAGQLIGESPIAGTGLGGFREELADLPAFRAALARWPEHRQFLMRKHPHSTALDVFVTQGAVGALFFASALALALLSAWRQRGNSPAGDAGTFFALLVWALGGVFDAYDQSGRALGLFAFCVSLCLSVAAGDAASGREAPRSRPAQRVVRPAAAETH